jgi:hypothetical protein
MIEPNFNLVQTLEQAQPDLVFPVHTEKGIAVLALPNLRFWLLGPAFRVNHVYYHSYSTSSSLVSHLS